MIPMMVALPGAEGLTDLLRQHWRCEPGQGITSLHVARLLAGCADWLVTVDPHSVSFDQRDVWVDADAL